VERMQTAELARSNIQRPYIRWDMKRASGRHPLEIKSIVKSYDGVKVFTPFTASVARGEKIALTGRNGIGQDDAAEIAAAQRHRICRGQRARVSGGWGHGNLGARGGRRLLRAGPYRLHHERDDGDRVAAAVRPAGLARGVAGIAGTDAFQRRGCAKADAGAVWRRIGAADFLPADAAEAELPGARRAHQSPGPGID